MYGTQYRTFFNHFFMANQGSPLGNSYANSTITKAQLKAWLNENPKNIISYVIQRNPTDVYNFIKANYGKEFANIGRGAELNVPAMEGMEKFLYQKYDDNPGKPHFIQQLTASISATAQLNNWTTPVN